MENKFQNLIESINYSDGAILSKVISKSGPLDITLFSMAKGTELSEHTSTKPASIYIIEGTGLFKLAGQKIKMLPGVLITMEKDTVHSLKAEENTSFILSLLS